MALSDLLREEAFLKAGGKPQGQRDIDKIQQTFQTIGQAGDKLREVAAQSLARKQSELQTQAAQAQVSSLQAKAKPLNQRLATGMPQPLTQDQSTSTLQNDPFGNLPVDEYEAVGKAKEAFGKAQEAVAKETPEQIKAKKTIGNVFPNITDDQIKSNYPSWVNRDTNFDVANDAARLEHSKRTADAAGTNRSEADATKDSNHQDLLEQQARNQILSIRGDASLKNIENQRDAAITAFNRISEVEKKGGVINPIDYVDILGQIYRARTGSAPTNEVLSTAKQETLKGNYGKAYTYFTGDQSPATTPQIMASLKDMARSMGEQTDSMHEAYMKPHMDMPTGLKQDRAKRLVDLGRGMSFAEATAKNAGNNNPNLGGGGPAVGTIDGGYKFAGGDPANPANWVKQ